ncbi:Pentatricopeptide repeat-containing protein At3g22670, mitochondrial [Linum perenne]
MLPSKRALMFLQNIFPSGKPTICYLIPRCLTSTSELPLTPESADNPESPDIPTWLRDVNSSVSQDPDDGDFFIPSLSSLFAKPSSRNYNKVAARRLLSGPNDADIDQVSEILKKRYTSVDGVVEVLNSCGVMPGHDLVLHILKRFSSDWVPALGVFTWAKHHTGYMHRPEVYNFMVDILGKCKKFTLMQELVEEMRGLEGYVSLFTMTKVMRRFAKDRQYENAIGSFRGLQRFGVTRDVAALNVLMDALVKECSVEHAHNVFLEFKESIPPNSNSFRILIHGYCKARMLENARRTMEDMKTHGFQPCVVCYTCFIEAYCKEKDFRNVHVVLDEMQKKGCKPNVVSYTIIMHALGKAKQTNEALEVYEKMKRSGCVPDASFYGSLIFILSSSGRIKDAWDVFRDMEKQGVDPNLLVYNTMIGCACAHWQGSHALELLQKMEEKSVKPDIKTYAPLLKLCCKNKTMRVLKLVMNHMFENDVSVDLGTYELLVRGLCMSGKLEEACSFFKEAVSKGMVPRNSLYKQLVEDLKKHSMTETKEMIEKLMSAVTTEEQCGS